jgi:hypothetical protein
MFIDQKHRQLALESNWTHWKLLVRKEYRTSFIELTSIIIHFDSHWFHGQLLEVDLLININCLRAGIPLMFLIDRSQEFI